MEDEELVKALKFAIEQKELDWAGYWDEKYQWIEFSIKDVLDLIQRLQAENAELTVENAELQKQVDELKVYPTACSLKEIESPNCGKGFVIKTGEEIEL